MSGLPRAAIAPVVGVAVLLAQALPAHAASSYSLRGEGEVVHASRADARALGGAETASATPSLTANPASLAFAERAWFYGTWVTEWIRSEETLPGGNEVAKEYTGLVPNLGLVFPLPRGWVLAGGLTVHRREDGTVEQPAATPDGKPYRQVYEVIGNQLRAPILVAYRKERVQLGAGLDLALLNSRVRWRNDFDNNEQFADSNDLDRISLFGVAWRAGVRVPIGPNFAAGTWFSIPGRLNGTRRFENDDSDNSDDREVDFGADLPARFGIGAEGTPHPRLRLAADWVREGWGDIDPLRPGDTLVNVNRIALGAEWGPAPTSERQSPLRAGYRTETLHARDGNGDIIREHALSVGSGFGFAGGAGEIDWFLEYGWRGVVDRSEYFEQTVRFGVTLTGFEEWSRRRAPESEEDW